MQIYILRELPNTYPRF